MIVMMISFIRDCVITKQLVEGKFWLDGGKLLGITVEP